jgi:23S rRNA (guanosine2251-2'-O)-methyltransferase
MAPAEGQVVFGVEPVRELIAAAPGAVAALYVRTGLGERFRAEVEAVRRAGGMAREVGEAELTQRCGPGARHQGLVALSAPYRYASLEDVLAERPDPLLVVDEVTDPRNLGAIVRSAECAGVRWVLIARQRTAPMGSSAIKSSAGAWLHVRVAQCANLVRALEQLKAEGGYWVGALTPEGATSIYDLDVGRRLALVVGGEGRGVRELVRKRSDFLVSIPMRGRIASLNVSVAAAVALFEIAHRRSGQAAG